jgi:hypothetical protein
MAQDGALKVTFEDTCVVVNDTDEYYFDSPQSVRTVGLLCAFLQTQDGFPDGMQMVPFSANGKKIVSRDVPSSTVAFVKVEPTGTPGTTNLILENYLFEWALARCKKNIY